MPEIVDVQITRFANEQIRPLADLVHASYFKALVFVQDYQSGDITGHLGKSDEGDLVADGSETDGRTRLSRLDIEYEYKILTEFISFLEGEVAAGRTRLDIIAKAHVNG